MLEEKNQQDESEVIQVSEKFLSNGGSLLLPEDEVSEEELSLIYIPDERSDRI